LPPDGSCKVAVITTIVVVVQAGEIAAVVNEIEEAIETVNPF
jgi:hypothetical protein